MQERHSLPAGVPPEAALRFVDGKHFGFPYPRLRSAREGIDRFLIPSTCVGLRPRETGWQLYAPNGLALMYQGVLARNPLTDHRPLFEAKARSYCSRWPWLRVAGAGELDDSSSAGA